MKQYFEGKHVDQNVIEGSLSLEEDAEHRASVEFERQSTAPPKLPFLIGSRHGEPPAPVVRRQDGFPHHR